MGDSALRISDRLKDVHESTTLKLNALVQTLKAKGEDVVNLTAGEPDFWVHDSVKAAAVDAIQKNQSRYTPVAGLLELRRMIAEKTQTQQPSLKEKWQATDVILSNGAKHTLFNAVLAVVNAGDEVLIPAPYWLSYPEMVKVAQGTPTILKTVFENRFKVTPSQLEKAITSKTRALIINSPSNPTGTMYSKAELRALGEVILNHPYGKQIWILSDEIYDQITYGTVEFCSFLEAVPELRNQVVTVNGLSKSAALTGWRVGWSVAQPQITSAMSALQGQATSGINSVAQWAAIAALKLSPSENEQHRESFKKRRDLTLDILRRSGKIRVSAPDGAFYAFIGVENCLRSGEDSVGFAERLLQDVKVAVVPGTPFGEPHFIRMSFALDEASLQKGCERIVQFVS